jgi:hypothetical protein
MFDRGLLMRRNTRLVATIVFTMVMAASALAQTVPSCAPKEPITAAEQLQVIRSCESGDPEHPHRTTVSPQAAGRIFVIVYGLAEYRNAYDKQSKKDPQLDPAKLVLFVDGKPLNNLPAQLPADRKHSHVVFDLGPLARGGSKEPDSRSWKTLLSDGIRDRKMTLSVGFPGHGQMVSDIDDFEMEAISWKWLSVWWLFAGGLLALLIWAGRASDMLRVPGDPPPGGGRKAYSLARTQMAVWFYTVLIGYLFIYLVTGALDTISATVLGMMGISAATGLAATLVEVKPGGTIGELSEGFVLDLARETSGVSLPRVQVLVWTVVLLGIFARAIYDTLAMPDFDATLLGLMGISGGTYVGFKRPDKNAESQPVTKPAP